MQAMHVPPELYSQPTRPLRRSEYERLAALGVFGDEKIELLHGVLVPMSPQGVPHAWVIDYLTMRLAPALVGRARIRVQLPFAASGDSEPEPDVAVVPEQSYRRAHPDTALLIVEVAESSYTRDRRIKTDLYAAAGVPEYWIVHLPAAAVEVHAEPVAGRYTRMETHGPEAILRPGAFPEVEIAVRELVSDDAG